MHRWGFERAGILDFCMRLDPVFHQGLALRIIKIGSFQSTRKRGDSGRVHWAWVPDSELGSLGWYSRCGFVVDGVCPC